MTGFKTWTRVLIIAGAVLTTAACASYPSEPRYSTRAVPAGQRVAPPAYPQGGTPVEPARSAYEAPLPARAPSERIEGGSLAAPGAATPAYPASAYESPAYTRPPPAAGAAALSTRATYEIQPGDTLSGVGRRFQTPVQSLIDLNDLGPRGAITTGQRLLLPEIAVDTGRDPYATGPSPVGVYVPEAGRPAPPPPPPPSGNAAMPPAPRQPAAGAPAAAATTSSVNLDWPVRGDILRRFGPVGMGERNNGINIGASAGTEVRAAAAGRVGYVGDDLAGQGLTVLVVHRDGWRSVYGHLGSAMVRDGDDVRAGQQIGTVGTTAGDGRPSIHFETWRMRGDEPTAIDPLTVLPR
ncbi:peptidoglycan DD-metalloendopeptidase family protein [uncultured Brevundimonas sp.]|uniref:peptidoglycan DD-metalloendopeptidase family protein n=1 Tax=uncultured Brevundimonas sp. TaxID=213418 RepID=UPI0030EE335C|tara:strand:+ start:735 stop:1790 length:1056 start_codon:yes stop_codon:yes gene_type:complete